MVTPGLSMTPRIIRYPVSGLSPIELTTLANAISLTPGTLSIDVSPDDEWLYVHAMYAEDRISSSCFWRQMFPPTFAIKTTSPR